MPAARERGVEHSRFSVHVRNDRTGEVLLVDRLDVYAADETDPRTGASATTVDSVRVRPREPLVACEACGFDVTLVPVDHPPLVCYGERHELSHRGYRPGGRVVQPTVITRQ